MRLSRLTASEHKADNRAVLIVGSIHDDALLAHENFTMEHFPSPLVLSLSTCKAPAGMVSQDLLEWMHKRWRFAYMGAQARKRQPTACTKKVGYTLIATDNVRHLFS